MIRGSKAWIAGLLLIGLAASLAAQEAVFRVDVRLVRMLATVKDFNGRPVGDLTQSEFRVIDSGVEQEVALFAHHTEEPLSVALLVDTSGSTAGNLSDETRSVTQFLRALFGEGNPDDQLALYSFNHDVTMESGFTDNAQEIEEQLRGLKADAGTSLYDAIYFSSAALASRDGRRVILIVTDGADTTSGKDFHAALEAAHDADVVIYGIMIIPITSNAGRHIAGENALISLTTGTGGRVFAATLGDDLDDAFADILRDLRTQYLLGYYPKGLPYTKERFHKIEVRVGRPNLRVLTRNGYYGDYGDTSRQGTGGRRPVRIRP
ncbi:MAG: VWA domain-containing protein [bacterium]|nr:VWA domain-containing protein [bacterium]